MRNLDMVNLLWLSSRMIRTARLPATAKTVMIQVRQRRRGKPSRSSQGLKASGFGEHLTKGLFRQSSSRSGYWKLMSSFMPSAVGSLKNTDVNIRAESDDSSLSIILVGYFLVWQAIVLFWCQDIVKNAHNSSPEPKCTSSKCLSPKPKDFSFTKQHIFKLKNLEPGKVLNFLLEKWLERLIN